MFFNSNSTRKYLVAHRSKGFPGEFKHSPSIPDWEKGKGNKKREMPYLNWKE